MGRPDGGGVLGTLKRRYVAAALIVFNTVLILTLVNLLLWPVLALSPRPERVDHNPAQFPPERLALVYGDLPPDVAAGTLQETWTLLRLEARPWVHYGEAAFRGRFVNVSAEGVRTNARPGAPAAASGGAPFRIFLFGGSTMWGYGVPDWETIPAHLERILRERHPGRAIEVQNYGRGFYYSTQESALFQSLLRRGNKPDAAVFLDGLNEFSAAYGSGEELRRDEPIRMERLRDMWRMDEAGAPVDRRLLPRWLPMVQLAGRLRDGMRQRQREPAVAAPSIDAAIPEEELREEATWIESLYLLNKRVIELVADEAGVTPYFFWQPVPQFAGDPSQQVFPHRYSWRADTVLRMVYDDVAAGRLAADSKAGSPALVDLSRLLVDYDRPPFVDAHHYTPAVCRLIAAKIADRIEVR